MSDLVHSLNDQQSKAALHATGPALVLAGAGSGKTRVLTTRAARLMMEEHVPPESILLVTFTNKAANEIKERVRAITGSNLPFAGTFHSLSARILRIDGYRIGLDQNFVIYDTADQLSLMKEIYKKERIDSKQYNLQATKSAISQAKNELITSTDYEQYAQGSFQQHVSRVYHLYQRVLAEAQAVDFDDLLVKVVQLLKTNDQIRDKYQNQLQHVLVDEYQDTNTVQYQLTKLFASPHNNLFVVGDFSQSIYAWRGANYRNMLLLSQDFPDLVEYQLEQNYRSTQTILDAATQVISHNRSHPILQLWTENTETSPIVCYQANTGEEEAQQVVRYIRSEQSLYGLDEIAILYRTNAQSRLFEEALIRGNVPYKLVGGTKFYERKEIKDLISYMRLVVNPYDIVSKDRIIKIGKRKYAAFDIWLQQQQPDMAPVDALKTIIEVTSYLDQFDPKDQEDISRVENIEELIAVASQFETIGQFLENIALIQDNYFIDDKEQQRRNGPAVTLMSLHSAKGLEYSVVFMVGMEEGLLPHSRSMLDMEQMEEERRLCYVGITRAKKKLYLTYARSRYQYGSSSGALRSRFIQDIDQSLLDLQPEGHSMGSSTNSSQRRIVVDEDMANDVLQGDIDLDTFINS